MSGPSRRALLRRLGSASTVAILGGCSARNPGPTTTTGATTTAGESIPIGSLVPETGAAGSYGESMQSAIKLAVEEINAAGGPLGRSLTLYDRDSETDQAAAESKFTTLADEKDVVAVVGPYSSGVGTGLASLAATNRVMLVSNGNTSPVLSSMGYRTVDGERIKYYARTAPSDEQQAKVMAHTLSTHVGADTAAFLYVNNAYGEGLATEAAAAFDGDVLVKESYDKDTADYTDTLDAVFVDDPDAVGFVGYPENGRDILTTWDDGDYGGDWVFADGIYDEALFGELSDIFEGQYITHPDPEETPGRDDFVSAMGGESEVSLFSSHAYDATYLIALAIEAAGEASGTAIARNIRSVSRVGETVHVGEFADGRSLLADGTDIDYQGASSDVDLSTDLEPLVRYVVEEITDGSPSLVEQMPVSWFTESTRTTTE